MIVAGTTAEETLSAIIRASSAFRVLPSATGSESLLRRVKSSNPDIVILDIDLPDFDWASATYELRQLNDSPGVILVAQHPEKANLLSAFREGGDAFLSKHSLPEELPPALRMVAQGRIFLQRKDADTLREHMLYLELGSARNVAEVKNGVTRLTLREKEVFPLLADGNSIKEVGKILGISPKTVETHKYHIMEKLNLKRMADLTKLAIIKDLIPL
jgi:DNA-binding NarL/FixJ family response regulator